MPLQKTLDGCKLMPFVGLCLALCTPFAARLLHLGAPPEQAQVMNVAVDYQTVNGLTIPGQLSMEVIGTGTFNFTFDGCSTNTK